MALIDKASLLFVPSVVAQEKAFNILPSGNRAPDNKGGAGYDQTRADFTFDRGTDHGATRIGSDGLIKKYRENLLLQSNQFDTTWANVSTTETSGQSGYDGTNDAWLLSKSAASAYLIQSISSTGVQTFSVYAKAGTLNWIRLNVNFTSGTDPIVYFDLANGVVGTSTGDIDTNITSVGNGWYRCSVTANGTISDVRFFPTDGDNDVSGTSGNIYIQNAQLESSMVSTDYLDSGATTGKAGVLIDLPRINYDANGENGSLLLEPSRANLAALSEYFEGWSHKPNTTATSNYTTSPEGLKNATRLQFTANGYLYNSNAPAQVNGTQYTLSCYAKRNDSGTQDFGFFGNGSGSVDSAMALTSEWKRFDYTYTATNVSQLGLAGVSGADVSVYGFQVEASASYPSSYIPNHGTSGGVTRAADECTGAGDVNTFNSTEGVLYFEGSALALTSSLEMLSLNDGTYNNIVLFRYYDTSSNDIQFQVKVGGSLQASILFTLSDAKAFNKIALKYKENDFALWVNGAKVGTDTSGTTFSANTLNKLSFNRGDGSNPLFGKVNALQVYKEALTDAELATLTTL